MAFEKIKDFLALRKFVRICRNYFEGQYSQMMYAFFNGKLTEEDLRRYFNNNKSVLEQIKAWEVEEKDRQMIIAKTKLKGKKRTEEGLNAAADELYILKYNFKIIERTNPSTAQGIKAKETKLANLQEQINYCQADINNIEEFLKANKNTVKYKIVKEESIKNIPKTLPDFDQLDKEEIE
jgi:hypothetical protein